MKFKVKRLVEIDIRYVSIDVAVRYGEENIPNDFPLRAGDVWKAIIDIDTGQIHDWPIGQSGELSMKVCDQGTYQLLDENMILIAAIEEDYVPHGVVPGRYGDYIELNIDANGRITNWPKRVDVSEFFRGEDE